MQSSSVYFPSVAPPEPPNRTRSQRDCARRPQLDPGEALRYTPTTYFASGGLLACPEAAWEPTPIRSHKADFSVGNGGSHSSLQTAVDAVIRCGARQHVSIQLLPGVHQGVCFIPAETPPLTIFGTDAAQVRLEARIDARMSTGEYLARFGSNFREGDPAWPMFAAIAAQPPERPLDTPGAAVMWSQAKDLQLAGLTITNSLLDEVGGDTHQAVALRSDGDRTQLDGVRLIGRQDTFFCNAGEPPAAGNRLGAYPSDRSARLYACNCYIEGDTDYVFGRASAVFEACRFHSVASRHTQPAVVFAPDTLCTERYGFLALRCRFTGDAHHRSAGDCLLGRSWDMGASAGYHPGVTANGQLVIRNSFIDSAYDPLQPWGTAATSRRPHRGQTIPRDNLDDPTFNRLWEFRNRGPGSGRG